MDEVGRLARAVLYEGYLLWPYRRSALKNQQRWTIGGVHPEPYGRAHEGYPWLVRTECLVEVGGRDAAGAPVDVAADVAAGATVDVAVRFLRLVVCASGGSSREEAVEREVAVRGLDVAALGVEPYRMEIDLPAGRETERAGDGGEVVRSWEAVRGRVEVSAVLLRPGLFRLGVEVVNSTDWCGRGRAEVMRRALVSAHMVLRCAGGGFVSMMDPPAEVRALAEGCRNVGVWPVLVGEPGDRGTVLSAPIILYDYPRIAPESPGDLFDATEIDQLLTLSVLALSDGEKREIREGDPRGREILERCAALTPEQVMRLHGVVRAEPAS